jgi:outer membrane protein assembly factor BamB
MKFTSIPRLAALFCWLLGSFSIADAQENWARFRGDNGTGISETKGFPTTFSPGDFRWNIELPGLGHGSPIIWGDKLFVTSATEDENLEGGTQRFLFCLNAETGEAVWSTLVGFNSSHKHKKNSFASSTPVTDGNQVFVAFADEQKLTLSAYSMDGELNWRRALGPFTSQHGLGISPIVFDDMVILPKDMMGPSAIMAFDAKTGETVWSTLRKIRKTSYSTPMILEQPGKAPQLICVSGASGVAGLNPYTGETIWHTKEFPMRTVASPVYGKGLIVVSDGGGGRGANLWAVDPSGTGDVTETHIKYERKRELPYVPTPIAYRDWFFLWSDQGIVSCVEIETGNNLWTQRVSDTTVSGSPICIDGKIYCADESGSVAVIDAAPEFKLYGKSTLGDNTHSTPAVAGGKLFFRTFNRLMCLDAVAGD